MEFTAIMQKDKITTALLYIGIFAGIPLAIIVALFFLPVLNSVDPAAIGILVIFTVLLVALWVFVPSKKAVVRTPRSAKERRAMAQPAVPTPSEVPEAPANDKGADQKREPFVDAVEKSTHRPASQPQIRRKAKSKARKKSSKKKR